MAINNFDNTTMGNASRGVVISFEGGDGSGKGTQSQMMYSKLLEEGYPVKFESFPRYDSPTGKKVAAYLNGELGEAVDSHTAGLLFSNDRLAFKPEMEAWLERGGIWVLDRYVESNSGHQGGKLPDRDSRMVYIKENARLEYQVNGMPEPDLTILFTLAPELAQAYIDQKAARSYTELKRDIHEADPSHLRNANESFLLLSEIYPNRVHHINTTADNKLEMLPRETIHAQAMSITRRLLAERGLVPNL